jgi:hypothetical protein
MAWKLALPQYGDDGIVSLSGSGVAANRKRTRGPELFSSTGRCDNDNRRRFYDSEHPLDKR